MYAMRLPSGDHCGREAIARGAACPMNSHLRGQLPKCGKRQIRHGRGQVVGPEQPVQVALTESRRHDQIELQTLQRTSAALTDIGSHKAQAHTPRTLPPPQYRPTRSRLATPRVHPQHRTPTRPYRPGRGGEATPRPAIGSPPQAAHEPHVSLGGGLPASRLTGSVPPDASAFNSLARRSFDLRSSRYDGGRFEPRERGATSNASGRRAGRG